MARNRIVPVVPKTVKVRPKELLDCAQITDILIFPGQDRRVLYDQIRLFLDSGYLLPVAREEGGKRAYLLTPDNILIADVLLRLREFGTRGNDDGPFAAAALALRSWLGKKPEGAAHSPAAHVIKEFEHGAGGWVFELWHELLPQSGAVNFYGRIHNAARLESTSPPLNGKEVLRGCYAVDLTDALTRVHPLGKRRREGMN